MTDRSSRPDRVSEERLNWAPPSKLETPIPPEGFKFRWVRTQTLGLDDSTNVVSRIRQHYEPVQASEYPSFQFEKSRNPNQKGAIQVGDLILMKVTTYIAEQRQKHYEGMAEKLQASVDSQLESESTKFSKRHTRIERDNRTEFEYGNPDIEISHKGENT